jgi:hypothetical protein
MNTVFRFPADDTSKADIFHCGLGLAGSVGTGIFKSRLFATQTLPLETARLSSRSE